MWGGISGGGFAEVVFHERKKLTASEWAGYVRAGKLTAAIKSLKPVDKRGPWHVLCDNESFLKATVSRAAYHKAKITLWQILAKSPDLNPVEKFWGWLRKRLRALDLKDMVAKRPPMGKLAYRVRVRAVCRTRKAQRVDAACARGLRKVCREVIRKGGAASRT